MFVIFANRKYKIVSLNVRSHSGPMMTCSECSSLVTQTSCLTGPHDDVHCRTISNPNKSRKQLYCTYFHRERGGGQSKETRITYCCEGGRRLLNTHSSLLP